jgi:hypothetical protein
VCCRFDKYVKDHLDDVHVVHMVGEGRATFLMRSPTPLRDCRRSRDAFIDHRLLSVMAAEKRRRHFQSVLRC